MKGAVVRQDVTIFCCGSEIAKATNSQNIDFLPFDADAIWGT